MAEDVEVSVSMELLRSKIPPIVYEMERAYQGEIGDYPEITDYMLEVQEFFRNCIGLHSSNQTPKEMEK